MSKQKLKKHVNRAFSIMMAAVLMAGTLFVFPDAALSAKKPALSKKKITVNVGKTYKIKIKNAASTSKVLWKTNKKNIAAIAKKNSKGKKAYAVIKGVSAGTAKITAVYKIGNSKIKLTCRVTVRDGSQGEGNAQNPSGQQGTGNTQNSGNQPGTDNISNNPGGDNAGNLITPGATEDPAAASTEDPTSTEIPVENPTATPDKKPTEAPTTKPIATPTPQPTATPRYVVPTNRPYQGYYYTVDLRSTMVSGEPVAQINGSGQLVINSTGSGNDTRLVFPETEIERMYTKLTIEYEVESGTHAFKYHKYGTGYDRENDYEWGDQYQFPQGQTSKSWTFVEAKLPIDEIVIFDYYSAGKITIKSITFSEPLYAIGTPNPTEDPSAPTATPDTPGPTTDPNEFAAISTFLQDTNYETPSGFDNNNSQNAGQIVSIMYPSTVIKQGQIVNRKANVALPKNYNTSKKYPVIYMAHGIFGNEQSMTGSAPVLWNAAAAGTAKEAILVFPNCCANESGSGDGFNTEHYKAYNNFLNDFEQCLKPYIDSHYSTYTDRAHTAICGFSMGGRVTLHLGFKLQSTFRYVGAFCPAPGIFDYTDMGVTDTGLFTKEEFTLEDQYMNDTLVMIVEGTNDTTVHKFPGEYHQALVDNEVPHIHYKRNGGHDGGVYNNGFYNFVRRIFK